MSALVLITAALLAFGAAFVVIGVILARRDSDGMGVVFVLGVFLVVGGGLALVFGVITPAITLGGRAYGRYQCSAYGRNNNRPVKYAVYASLDQGQCLTPAGNGKWIPTDNLREFGSQP